MHTIDHNDAVQLCINCFHIFIIVHHNNMISTFLYFNHHSHIVSCIVAKILTP